MSNEDDLARWAPSVAAAAASTSYEDYLERLAALAVDLDEV
jgi:hypothetical protein